MVLLLSLLEREANDCLEVRVESAKMSAIEMHQRCRKLGSIRKLKISAFEMQ